MGKTEKEQIQKENMKEGKMEKGEGKGEKLKR